MVTSEQQTASEVEKIVGRYGAERSSLIPILQDVQDRFGYLSEEAVDGLGRLIGVSPNEIYGVATFYAQFRFSPPGEHIVHVCLGTACHVRGGQQVLKEIERRLGIEPGETTADGKFDLERVACVGCCALAPVVVVDGKVHSKVAMNKIPSILPQCEGEGESEDV